MLSAIDSAGVRDSTLVIWTADNGPWTQEEQRAGSVGPFGAGWLRDTADPSCTVCPDQYTYSPASGLPRRCVGSGGAVWTGMPCGSDAGLGSSWEGNMRVPAIVRWPGHVKPGTVSSEMVSTLDILPTALSVAKIELPTDRVIDGKDITTVLEGTSPSPHQFLFFYRQFNVAAPKLSAPLAAGEVPAATVPPRPELAAVKHGNWKAHFATASARGPDLRVLHNPPLLFQVARDPAERWPVPTQGPDVDPAAIAALAAMVEAAREHLAGLEWTYGDGLTIATNLALWPCCNESASCRCGKDKGA